MTMSFLKLGIAATPGKVRMARLMSRPPPGFRLISLVPRERTLSGASAALGRRAPTTSASSISMVEGLSMMFTTAGRAGVTSISNTVFVSYPKKLT